MSINTDQSLIRVDPPSNPSNRISASVTLSIRTRELGCVDYQQSYDAMRRFSAERDADTVDELWLLEHPPVYTLGQAGKPEHLLQRTDIPVVYVDRGGQITYHGPGQVVVYTLIDLKRRGIGIRDMVRRIEQSVIDLLVERHIAAERVSGAPGVYVGGAKIAALGLRVRNGRCYHGVALNVDCDLGPFQYINPCGYPGLAVARTIDLGVQQSAAEVGHALLRHIAAQIQTAV